MVNKRLDKLNLRIGGCHRATRFLESLTLALIRYELILGLKSSNFRHPARLNLSIGSKFDIS